MTVRLYRADSPSASCADCVEPFGRVEGLTDPLTDTCPGCGNPVHVVIQPVTIGAMDPRLSADPLYMSQLARFPGDPEAYVSGPHSWQKKIDEAQRNGARVISSSEDTGDLSPREIKRKERGHGS
ncbi:MAG: hypothetical protein JSV86_04935 [Gemmatimonadota bacterium]|nr:MAG: hypothetical protein JSV86_04935 [Gemmatimonadota bacterium]